MSGALADVVDPVDVLEGVRIVLLEFCACSFLVELPDDVALEVADCEVLRAPVTLGSVDSLAYLGSGSVDLAAH